MRSPLLIVLATSALAFTAACSASEEEVAPSGTSPTPSSAQASSTAPTPSPVPSVSPAAVPADWATYSDPSGLFTIRYPANWFKTAGQAQFSSYDLSTLTTVRRPREAITVEVNYREAAGSDTCGGTISTDIKSGENLGLLPGATATTLGGVAAGEVIRAQGDPAISEEDLTRIHGLAVVHRGYCLLIAAYYTQQNPDIDVPSDIK